jgi:hypothetical protein
VAAGKKGNGKQPRTLATIGPPTPETPVRKLAYLSRIEVARQQAAIDYITDPEGRSMDFHFRRSDRAYSKLVHMRTWDHWASLDRWTDRREQFWKEIEQKLMNEWRDRLVAMRLTEIEEMTKVRGYMAEYLSPLKDNKGEVKRDPETGLPVYGLYLPKMDGFINMFLALDKQIMLKRGEATTRTEGSEEMHVGSLDPVSAQTKLSKEDLRAMARVMVLRRQPELSAQEVGAEEDGTFDANEDWNDGEE